MDHKEFFEEHGDDRAPYLYSVTIEQLYQAIKQRLIDELAVTPPTTDHNLSTGVVRAEGGRLIDTSEQE